jgi:lipoyl(octanoyl) transferase
MPSFRCIPFSQGDGPFNMAADDVLLLAAARGITSLRFYGWTHPTLSLGYFQAAALRHQYPQLASLPWLRRSSGGGALVHHHELTYALALPAGFAADWMPRMHQRVILPALDRLRLAGQVKAVTKPPCETAIQSRRDDSTAQESRPPFLCFEQQTVGDLVCAGHKIVGSAQRKKNHCMLQHGAILLAQSEFAPTLPGVKELAGVELSLQGLIEVMVDQLSRETGWRDEECGWSAAERDQVQALVGKQYGCVDWNEKR